MLQAIMIEISLLREIEVRQERKQSFRKIFRLVCRCSWVNRFYISEERFLKIPLLRCLDRWSSFAGDGTFSSNRPSCGIL